MSALAVVLVTYDSADGLPAVLDALAAQRRPGDELVVVDNASRDASVAVARAHPAVDRVLETGGNLGFAAGCNRGADATSAPTLLFLNPDAVPQPGCLDALRAAPADWAAWQGVVLMGDGRHVNSAGNEVHFLGFSWAGRPGEPVEGLPAEPWEAPALSGACLAVRREAWTGFPEHFFMYCEDLDLTLRLRLAGRRTGVVPAARVVHDYAFDKGAGKRRLLERNRWMCVLRCWPTRLLLPTLPLLLALEPVLLAIALREGWAGAKARAIGDVAGGLPRALRERREVQAARVLDPDGFAALLRSDLGSPYFGPVGASPLVARLLGAAWRTARGLAGVR
jgi:GT2 family glycosyltransferase